MLAGKRYFDKNILGICSNFCHMCFVVRHITPRWRLCSNGWKNNKTVGLHTEIIFFYFANHPSRTPPWKVFLTRLRESHVKSVTVWSVCTILTSFGWSKQHDWTICGTCVCDICENIPWQTRTRHRSPTMLPKEQTTWNKIPKYQKLNHPK